MFGYLKPDFSLMGSDSKKTYKSIYCSICRVLKTQYRYKGVSCLNYETVFVALVALALSPNPCILTQTTCSISPLLPRKIVDTKNEFIFRAAILSYMYMYYKVVDNVIDEGTLIWNSVSKFMQKDMLKSQSYLRVGAETLRYSLDEINKMEQNLSDIESLSSTFGILYAEMAETVCLFRGKPFFYDTYQFFTAVGTWIYIMDAIDDMKKDEKNNNYNPIITYSSLNAATELLKRQLSIIKEISTTLPFNRYNALVIISIQSMEDKTLQLINNHA